MKEVLWVSIGSFFGGGMRFLVSKVVQAYSVLSFPFGTMAVNVLGCLLIGFLSGLTWSEDNGVLTPGMKLLLTTGFCGGFTTFSTFMNESSALLKDGQYACVMLYVFGSLVLGLLAVLAGHLMGKAI